MNQHIEAEYIPANENLIREEEESQAAAAALGVLRDSGSEQDSDYEDEQIKCLEQKGGQNYFGPQSLLSQEIHATGGGLSQETATGAASVEEEEDPMAGLSQVSMNTSVTFDSQKMVSHYGLLTQEDAPPRIARVTDISSTTMSSSHGGFGTLLDAVSIFQSQELEEEEEKAKIFSDEAMKKDPVIVGTLEKGTSGWLSTEQEDSQFSALNPTDIQVQLYAMLSNSQSSSSGTTSSSRKRKQSNTACDDTKKSKSKPSRNRGKNPKNISSSCIVSPSSPKMTGSASDAASKKRKRNDDEEQRIQQQLANRAADLAQRTINEPELAKRLLLSMALTRENPRSAPKTLPGPGHVLPEGFFWAHYPPLEQVLKDNMAEYYELSITKCQSAQQQSFNNTLVNLIRVETDSQKWVYAESFTDKILRDRIRCYYKTHIQNAKKRLRTMIKNPTKKANARHLCAHLDMIEKTVEKNASTVAGGGDPQTTDVITHKDWGSGYAGPAKQDTQNTFAWEKRAECAKIVAEVKAQNLSQEESCMSHDDPFQLTCAASMPSPHSNSEPAPLAHHPHTAGASLGPCHDTANPMPPNAHGTHPAPSHYDDPPLAGAFPVADEGPTLPYDNTSHHGALGPYVPPTTAKEIGSVAASQTEAAPTVAASVATPQATFAAPGPAPESATATGKTQSVELRNPVPTDGPPVPSSPPLKLSHTPATTGEASLVSVDSTIETSIKEEEPLFV